MARNKKQSDSVKLHHGKVEEQRPRRWVCFVPAPVAKTRWVSCIGYRCECPIKSVRLRRKREKVSSIEVVPSSQRVALQEFDNGDRGDERGCTVGIWQITWNSMLLFLGDGGSTSCKSSPSQALIFWEIRCILPRLIGSEELRHAMPNH